MADQKISELTAITNAASEDLIVVVDDPTGTPANKKISLLNVFANVASNTTHTGTLTTTANSTFQGSRFTVSANAVFKTTAGISAAGTTQGTGTALVSKINEVTTVAAGANAVVLPTAVAGASVVVINADSSDVLGIFPAADASINGLAANAAASQAAGVHKEYFAANTTQWYSIQ
tara:strand:- start:1841 stop:2368 length:528 start_codon:yes stop_codon:yes gene_type:complete